VKMLTSVRKTTAAAAQWPPVPTLPAALTVAAILAIKEMASSALVRSVIAQSCHVKNTRVKTRSSATTEKQRVSCACLPRLANWSCNAQNNAESQRLCYFMTFKRS